MFKNNFGNKKQLSTGDENALMIFRKVARDSEKSLTTDPLKPPLEILSNAVKKKGLIDKVDLELSVFVLGLELINKGINGLVLNYANNAIHQIVDRNSR